MSEVEIQPPPPTPVPVTIIAGFLGSGKTTLLNYILHENHGVRAAVLVNDFGAINIDAKLIVGVEDEAITLRNGCICCDIRGDLLAACMSLLARPDPPERLVIETSGVSDPLRVAETFAQPEIYRYMALDNILSVVDAERFEELLQGEMADLTRSQVQVADIVVLNKVDLVSGDRLASAELRVREVAPRSRILQAAYGRIPLALALGDESGTGTATPLASDEKRHVVHRHDPQSWFSTWYWESDRPLSLPKVRAALESMPDTVYRAKGVIYLEELPGYRVVMQMVGKRYDLSETVPWGDAARRSEIVLIASHDTLDSPSLRRRFEDCVGHGDESASPVLRLSRRLGLG